MKERSLLLTTTIAKLRQEALRLHIPLGKTLRLKREIQVLIATIKIQRWFKLYRCRNTIDPFSLEPFPQGRSRKKFFVHVEESGALSRFEPFSLYTFFLRTGQFKNPFTRTELNMVELHRLYSKVWHMTSPERRLGIVPLHLYSRQIQQERRLEMETRQTIDFLTSEAAQILSYLWNPVVGMASPTQVMQQLFFLCDEALPLFVSRLEEIRQLNSLSAQFLLKDILDRLREVVQRPNPISTMLDVAQRNNCFAAHDILFQYYQRIWGVTTARTGA